MIDDGRVRVAFRHLDAEGREEAVQEVTAYAVIAFKELWDRGKAELAYPSVLALYGIKRVKIGRMTATPLNCKDVSSTYCQLQKNVTLERLDRFDKYEGVWLEAVVEDHHAPVVEQVWFRIDFPAWLSGFPDRDRQIAEAPTPKPERSWPRFSAICKRRRARWGASGTH